MVIMQVTITFGAWVKEIRERKGWSIALCAGNMGWKWNQWQRLEQDEPRRYNGEPSQPRRETVLRIAKALNVEPVEALHAAGYAPTQELTYEPVEDEVELLAFYRGIPTEFQPAAKAAVKGILDAAAKKNEGKVVGRRVAEKNTPYNEGE